MKIAYIDSKVNNPPEDYALNAKGYGGGSCFGRYAKNLLNRDGDEFYIFGSQDCFKNLSFDERPDRCIAVSEKSLSDIRNGARIKDHIPSAETFDLFIHHHDLMTFNMEGLNAPLVHWALMGDGGANRGNPYTLLYKPGETAMQGKGFPIKIGKYVPPIYIPSLKEDYIFQCSRHDQHMNTIEVAKFCLQNRIRGIFAGPILDNYPLMNYIDGQTTIYLGSISEKDKMDYTAKATLCTFLFNWDAPFNQSAIEALSVGTPIVANNRGFFSYLLKDKFNGFFYNNNLLDIYRSVDMVRGQDCWVTAKEYSHEVMVDSFYNAFKLILEDWQKK